MAAPNIETISRMVAAFYGIDHRAMRSDNRACSFSHPRQVAMYLARELSDASYPLIGKLFGRDHTTVIHAHRAVTARAVESAEYAAEITFLREQVTSASRDEWRAACDWSSAIPARNETPAIRHECPIPIRAPSPSTVLNRAGKVSLPMRPLRAELQSRRWGYNFGRSVEKARAR